jgi:hypothetical protein
LFGPTFENYQYVLIKNIKYQWQVGYLVWSLNKFGTYIKATSCLFGCDQCWAILFYFQEIIDRRFLNVS